MKDDNLIICPKCGCDGCYKTQVNEVKHSYFCWGCGYQTSDLMVEGEFNFEEYEEVLPELYKDVKYVDSEKRVWYPITLNILSRGTVFLFGTCADDVRWAAIKAVPLTEDEKKEPKYKELTHKSDAKSLKYFDADFVEACDYIGVFEM